MKKSFTNDYILQQMIKRRNQQQYDETALLIAIYFGIIASADDFQTIEELVNTSPNEEISYYDEEIDNYKEGVNRKKCVLK